MRPTRFRRLIAEGLAAAFLDGDGSPALLVERGALALGRHARWLRRLAHRMHEAFPSAPRDAIGELASRISEDPGFQRALERGSEAVRLRRFFLPAPAMRAGRSEWNVAPLSTTGDVAAWLGVDVSALAWLADWRGLARHDREERLRHYVRRWVPKPSGGVRLLEAPKSRLKAIQRRVLREILDRVPPHDGAHGFRIGRGVLTHAAVHAGRAVVLRLDLEDFFASIPASRVYGVFRGIGYPEEVSRVLAGLCTSRSTVSDMPPLPASATLSEIAARYRARQRYGARHLPQGAPTSPALANLCALGLDVRLAAAAKAAGASYTRYADDLVFSGGPRFARSAPRFAALASAVALDEGFRVQHRKTRLMRRGVRQEVTGLVVNERAAVSRDALDRLRAILHNCARFGPEGQNREGHRDFRAHLEGAVAWVCHVQPARGARLRAVLDRVHWPAG